MPDPRPRPTGLARHGLRVAALAVAVLAWGCGPREAPPADRFAAKEHAEQGHVYLHRGQLDEALREFDAAVDLDPANTLALTGRGVVRTKKGDLDGALADFDAAVRLDKKDAEALYHRGVARQQKKELDGAVDDYTEAVRLRPDYPDPYVNRAAIWAGRKEWDKAIADYSAGIKLDSASITAFTKRSEMWQHKKEFDKAVADLDTAAKLEPEAPAVLLGRAWLLATCPDAKYRDGKAAVGQATRACELTGWEGGKQLATLAAAHAECGQFDEAVKWQAKALEDAEFLKEHAETARRSMTLFQQKQPVRQ